MRINNRKNTILWTVQVLLALLFLFAGGSKLVMPLSALQAGPVALPGLFIRFIGVAEVAGALGLVLPGLFRIKHYLTPVAATGLVLIMSGAVTVTIESGMVGGAIVPFVVGALAVVVANGRRSWVSPKAAQSAPKPLVARAA